MTKKKLFLLAITLCLLLVLPACSSSSTPDTPSPSSPPSAAEAPQISEDAISISAADLLTAYEANEVAADAKYKGQDLLVTGVVDTIGKDLFDTPYVTLTNGEDFAITSVQCYFKKSDESELAKVTKGQTVSIQGECDGKTLNIGLDDCAIIVTMPMSSAAPAAPSSPAVSQPDEPAAALEISSADLCAAYDANEVSADAKYKGKQLEITGEITSIGVDLMDKSYVTLSDGKQFSIMGVQCFFAASDEGELAKLSKGQTITIKGTGDGYMLNVHVKNCTVVASDPASAPASAPVAASGETVEVSSEELYEAYSENQVAANVLYKDKKLIVTGTITDIGKVAVLEIPYVNLKGADNGILGVQCLFSKSDEAALAGLSNGQEVTIEGEFMNFTVMVGLENCSLVSTN